MLKRSERARTFTRHDLRAAIYHCCPTLSPNEARKIFNETLVELSEALIRGEPVQLRNFGTFNLRAKRQRTGRNPKTGVEAAVSARRVVTFRPSPALLTRINQKSADCLPSEQRSLKFQSARASPVVTRGNQRAIECVVANLIDNALRAEPESGTVLIRVGDDAVVEVIDHSEGVAPSDREMISEPFWRRSEATPGTGLGLAIAKELVDKHHGRIWVEETPGGGANFKISFQRTNSS